jgi:hypothetical protein
VRDGGRRGRGQGLPDLGASAFIVSSDQGFLRRIAAQTLAEMTALAR